MCIFKISHYLQREMVGKTNYEKWGNQREGHFRIPGNLCLFSFSLDYFINGRYGDLLEGLL